MQPTPTKPSPIGSRAIDMSYLEGTIGYSIRRAQIAVFQSIYRSFDDETVTLVQFSLMAVVADNPQITQAELAEVLAVERPRIVPLLNKLEEMGLVQRLVCGTDKRSRRIVMTAKGSRALAELKRRFAMHEKQLEKLMGGERELLLAMLHKVSELAG